MLSKLYNHGSEIFDTYELLEMLLYFIIPYKDVNPLAKNLLYRFGGIGDVLLAEPEELCQVGGVGKSTAEFLGIVKDLAITFGSGSAESTRAFHTYEEFGSYFALRHYHSERTCLYAMYLDNNKRPIAIEEVEPPAVDHSDATVDPQFIVETALNYNASSVVTAYAYPQHGFHIDRRPESVNSVLSRFLPGVGINYLEHFVINSRYYVGLNSHSGQTDVEAAELSKNAPSEEPYSDFTRKLISLLGTQRLPNDYTPEELAGYLSVKYEYVEDLFSANITELEEVAGRSIALLIKLIAHITGRSVTDHFKKGGTYSQKQISDYLKSLYIADSEERLCLISLDSAGKLIKSEQISRGTVNASYSSPRLFLDRAVKNRAHKVIIAHNHPHGAPEPSGEDMEFNLRMYEAFSIAGIEYIYHCIVAGARSKILNIAPENNPSSRWYSDPNGRLHLRASDYIEM